MSPPLTRRGHVSLPAGIPRVTALCLRLWPHQARLPIVSLGLTSYTSHFCPLGCWECPLGFSHLSCHLSAVPLPFPSSSLPGRITRFREKVEAIPLYRIPHLAICSPCDGAQSQPPPLSRVTSAKEPREGRSQCGKKRAGKAAWRRHLIVSLTYWHE